MYTISHKIDYILLLNLNLYQTQHNKFRTDTKRNETKTHFIASLITCYSEEGQRRRKHVTVF